MTAEPLDRGWSLSFSVSGTPAPQGSKKAYNSGGRIQMKEDNPRTEPWRESVRWAAIRAMNNDPDTAWPLTGPLAVTVDFRVPRPASAPKRRVWPDRKPDLDKLLRAVCDALESSGLFVGDQQVCVITAAKEYGRPGATITVRRL